MPIVDQRLRLTRSWRIWSEVVITREPGGTPLGALLHSSRTIARRAERSAWAAVEASPDDTNTLPAKYLNRLSDLLFVLARVLNRANLDGLGGDDVYWRSERLQRAQQQQQEAAAAAPSDDAQ